MKKLVAPYRFLNLNECPICGGILQLEEREVTTTELDNRGRLVLESTETELLESKLCCCKCGSSFDVAKDGPYFYIPTIEDKERKRKKKKKMNDELSFNIFYC